MDVPRFVLSILLLMDAEDVSKSVVIMNTVPMNICVQVFV